MAEIAVSLLLEQLTPFLQNKVELLKGIPQDLDYIKDELQSMKAVLRVADSLGETNQELKVWVHQDLDYIKDDAFLHKVCCFSKNLKSQHRISSKINVIKSRISNVSAKHPNFDSNGTNEQGPSSINVSVNPWMDRRGDALLLDSIDLVGIDKSKEQLIDWLVAENTACRKVVSEVGMGGSGKTTLAKQVYDNAKVKKQKV